MNILWCSSVEHVNTSYNPKVKEYVSPIHTSVPYFAPCPNTA